MKSTEHALIRLNLKYIWINEGLMYPNVETFKAEFLCTSKSIYWKKVKVSILAHFPTSLSMIAKSWKSWFLEKKVGSWINGNKKFGVWNNINK